MWRKGMSGNLFLSKKIIKTLEKDLKKRKEIEQSKADIDDKIEKDMAVFYNELDTETMYKVFNHIEEHGNKKQKEALEEIKDRYNKKTSEGGGLLIEDTLKLTDWYDIMCNYHENDDYLDR